MACENREDAPRMADILIRPTADKARAVRGDEGRDGVEIGRLRRAQGQAFSRQNGRIDQARGHCADALAVIAKQKALATCVVGKAVN